GIGATGNGEPGESFPTVAEGVRAHLQHLMLYAGMPIDNPVADRTRKVLAWKVLDPWRNRIRGPVRYDQMTAKWSPGDRGYPRDIKAVADRFMSGPCRRADPQPELIAGIRDSSSTTETRTATSTRRSRDVASANTLRPDTRTRSSLGAPLPNPNTNRGGTEGARNVAAKPGQFSILNGGSVTGKSQSVTQLPSSNDARRTTAQTTSRNQDRSGTSPTVGRFASNLFAAIKPPPMNKKSAAPKACRVWTASYGGQRALIIKSLSAGHVNYTVLDVNKGREKREADAYIAAYAKGGETIAEFGNPEKALAKAFKLCPAGSKQS
ncbi:MAG: hypothetical protein AAFY64_04475, partial [Pseudomonadota bacterium]